MDVRTNDEGDLVVTKGDQYDVREKDNPSGSVKTAGADQPMLAVVRAAAECVFVPLTIGGGIKDTVDPDGTKHSALEVAAEYFRAGADKVSLASEAVYAVEKLLASPTPDRGDGTSAIETIARGYGRQAVVVSIDPKRMYLDAASYDGPYKAELVHGEEDSPIEAERGKSWWYTCTTSGGRVTRDLSVCQLARGVEILGAGELLVNSIDRDGTGLGFDLDLIRLVRGCVKIPVVASSGAGKPGHFLTVFKETGVEAALAAGIFHRREVGIDEVKDCLKANHINVRTHIA
ncbi:hypothetical protein MPER_08139 [Moniliophthora perniciosa FA553]|nr:hypothetical protein MPER_08139 [Moniliophthora perniciosa FA553]